jgi:hypothetical protein
MKNRQVEQKKIEKEDKIGGAEDDKEEQLRIRQEEQKEDQTGGTEEDQTGGSSTGSAKDQRQKE